MTEFGFVLGTILVIMMVVIVAEIHDWYHGK